MGYIHGLEVAEGGGTGVEQGVLAHPCHLSLPTTPPPLSRYYLQMIKPSLIEKVWLAQGQNGVLLPLASVFPTSTGYSKATDDAD